MNGSMEVNEGMKRFEQTHLSIGCKIIQERKNGASPSSVEERDSVWGTVLTTVEVAGRNCLNDIFQKIYLEQKREREQSDANDQKQRGRAWNWTD